MNPIDTTYLAVLEDPFDRMAKAAFADALQEYGNDHQASLGEYIHSCLSGPPAPPPTNQQLWNWYGEMLVRAWPGSSNVEAVAPEARGVHNATTWEVIQHRILFDAGLTYRVSFYAGKAPSPRAYTVGLNSGVIGAVRCSEKAWLKNAHELCRWFPVSIVELTDRYPVATFRRGFRFFEGTEHHNRGSYLDKRIFQHLVDLPAYDLQVPAVLGTRRYRTYLSQEVAHLHLSAACVNYGRQPHNRRPLLVRTDRGFRFSSENEERKGVVS